MKALIGIGDSWTQGEGGYPDEIWRENNGRMWKKIAESKHLIPIEQENSWVNKLSKKLNYTPINLGQRAIGNRGAVRSLYLNDFSKFDGGVIVFMLSGFDRFDFFDRYWRSEHYKFITMWPFRTEKEEHIMYTEKIYSEEAVAAETACCIVEAQNFAKANGFEFILANAFETREKEYFNTNCPEISNKIDWSRYVHSHTTYDCFARLLVIKDGLCSPEKETVADFYPKLPYPATYMTNDIHPTIKGYELIADEIYKTFYV